MEICCIWMMDLYLVNFFLLGIFSILIALIVLYFIRILYMILLMRYCNDLTLILISVDVMLPGLMDTTRTL